MSGSLSAAMGAVTVAVIFSSGFPSTTIKSASFPAAILPASRCSAAAAFTVAVCSAWNGVIPVGAYVQVAARERVKGEPDHPVSVAAIVAPTVT